MKITAIILFLGSLTAFSQEGLKKEEREKYPTSFAIQLRGLVNNRAIEGPLVLTNDINTSTIEMRNGFSFGGIIRRRFTDNLGVELGLNHTKRFFDLEGVIHGENATITGEFAQTNFELPVNGLVFIKFSQKFYGSAGLGVSTIYKPSSVTKEIVDKVNDRKFAFFGFSDKNKIDFNVNAQFGFEYRTEKYGTMYIGGGASIPTGPMFEFVSAYADEGNGNNITTYESGNISSPFFSLDLRFYFPKIRNKGVQPNKGPIE